MRKKYLIDRTIEMHKAARDDILEGLEELPNIQFRIYTRNSTTDFCQMFKDTLGFIKNITESNLELNNRAQGQNPLGNRAQADERQANRNARVAEQRRLAQAAQQADQQRQRRDADQDARNNHVDGLIAAAAQAEVNAAAANALAAQAN